MRYILLLVFILLMTLGQLLFKRIAIVGEGRPLIEIIFNLQMILALIVYGAATVLWVMILRITPLSIAYPFAALAVIMVPAVGVYLFEEEMTWKLVVGILLIVSGIIVANV